MAAYDPIQARFNEVIRDFKTKLNNDKLYDEIRNFRSAEDVYDAADRLQAEQGKNGHLRHLSKIGPFLERMQDYSEAIETFVQVKSDILGLIWGPMRLLLQWTSVLKQSFDAILNTTSEIGDLLPEFLEVTKLFDRNAQLKDVLVLFFQDIVDFYLVALQFFGTSKLKYVFEAFWPRQRDRIKLVMTHIKRHALLMRNEVRLEHIREEHQARLDAIAHFEKSEKANIRQEHEIIRNSISPISYNKNLNWYHGRVCDGTNQWLMDEQVFMKWLDQNDDTTRLLWLKGIPGSGKTFLAGAVIDKAKTCGRTVFAFLSHVYASNTTALSVLHSLIFQLTFDDIDLQAILCQSSRENIGSDTAVAASVLSTLLSSLDVAYIVIDGLDEVDKIERGRLLSHLIEISNTCVKTKILISSRPESDIVSKTDSCFLGIRVDDHNTSSIQVFVTKKTNEFLKSRDFLEEDKAEINALLAPIAAKAKGMFLYAKILLDCIELLHDVETIRDELQVLPQDLHDAYGRILSRINGLRSVGARQNARQILGWIGCSPSPLTVREIEQALLVKLNDENAMMSVRASLNLVELCGPIVEIEDGYVRLVHFTVKEYIFDKGILGYVDLIDTTLDLANRCIYYLCGEQFDEWLTDDEIKEHLLLGSYRLHYYAMTYWCELTTRSLGLHGSDVPPASLIAALELLIFARRRYNFDDFPVSSDQVKRPELDALDQYNKPVAQMLRHVIRFDQQLAGSAVHLNDLLDWKWPAPLMNVETSRQVHNVLDNMICERNKHIEHCVCATLEHHYDSCLFKCGYLDCPSFRQGFSKKSSRKSHEKLHVKPWKCNEVNCEYAEIGFVSQTMRDTHTDTHRQAQKPQADLSSELHNQKDIQALIIDLIRLDKISEVEALLPHLHPTKSYSEWPEIMRTAIEYGSTTLINIVLDPKYVKNSSMACQLLVYAATKENLQAIQVLKPQIQHVEFYSCFELIRGFVSSESSEARQECEALLLGKNLFKADDAGTKHGNNLMAATYDQRLMCDLSQSKERELRLISLWMKIWTMNLVEDPKVHLRRAFAMAVSISSILLAKALIREGAIVEGRVAGRYEKRTLLQLAALKNNEKNAKMMEFLLYHGADPQPQLTSTKLKISEEKGARGIAKWLNMSWEELIEKVKADRARGYCPPEYRLDVGVDEE